MFAETAALGGLEMQPCYDRGMAEFEASDWLTDSASRTPRNLRRNHAGQHFWPNLFLGRRLKGFWCLRKNSADHEAVRWECRRGSVG
jgi:hypothetical protein